LSSKCIKFKNWINNHKGGAGKSASAEPATAPIPKKPMAKLVQIMPPKPVTAANFAPQLAKKMAIDAGEGTGRDAINSHMAEAYNKLKTDEDLQRCAQEYADSQNQSHFVKKKRYFSHYRKAIQKCHDGIKEIGGDIITFGVVEGNVIFTSSGRSADDFIKLMKRRSINLTGILKSVQNMNDLQNLSESVRESDDPAEMSVEKTRKDIKSKLKRKYRSVYPDSNALPYSSLSKDDMKGWPEDVDWSRHRCWSKSELDKIQEALVRIEFKKND
jgi:hypothetical protein